MMAPSSTAGRATFQCCLRVTMRGSSATNRRSSSTSRACSSTRRLHVDGLQQEVVMARRRERPMRTLLVVLTCIVSVASSANGSGQRTVEGIPRGYRPVENERRRELPHETLDDRGSQNDNVVLIWNATLLDAVRAVRFAPMFTARALAIMHTCMYDAWSAYDAEATGTVFGDALRRPRHERTIAAKTVAVSYAAYAALVDLFPSRRPSLERVMRRIGLDPLDRSTDPSTPAGVGNLACGAVLEWRHHDGSNQLGDLNGGAPYTDYTGYVPVNTPTQLADPDRWQPLLTATGAPQAFLAPHWGHVAPFALTRADQFRPPAPPQYPDPEYLQQTESIRRLS